MKNENESTAKTLSKNKIKKFSDQKLLVEKNSDKSNFLADFQVPSNNLERGWYDIASLNLRYINTEIFNRNCPIHERKKKLFKIFVASRAISAGFNEFEGCKININKILPEFKKTFFDKKNDIDKKLFDFCLQTFLKKNKDLKMVSSLLPNVEEKKIKKILQNIENEEKFYICTNELIDTISFENDDQNSNQPDQDKQQNDLKSEKKKTEKLKKIQITKKTSGKEKEQQPEKDSSRSNDDFQSNNNLNYTTYTKQFDIFTKAERLVKYNELKLLRKKFDEECKDNSKLINNLAKKLEKLLYSLDFSTWKFDQEQGFFDSSRFPQFIANPSNSHIYKIERENTEKNTVVSLLLDNSGSMRGKPIVTSAMTAEIITKTLEKCRVNVEILGFTTKEWKGGLSKKLWEKNKRIPNPGRLNDLLHIVYKDADTPWNQAKLNLGLVLKDGILKENIDGEALIWASNRLKKRSEKKKILIVISDGAPVDDSTLSCNNSNILDNHLREVVSNIEKKKLIDLVAIGIGHDVSKYYSKAFTIDDVEKLGEIIIDNLTELLKEKR